MTTSHSHGTVSPYLPLTDEHRDLLCWDPDDASIGADGESLLEPEDETDETRERAKLDKLAYSLGLTEEYRNIGIPDYEPSGDDSYYLYCENGFGEEAAYVLQHILKSLPEEEYPYVYVEGANYESRGRVGGGWACFISRNHIAWSTTWSWILSQKEEYEKFPRHWRDDPDYPASDWAAEVANDDTRQSYVDWVHSQKELINVLEG